MYVLIRFQIRKNIYKDMCPEIKMTFGFRKKSDGSIITVAADSTPLSKFQRDPEYDKLYEEAHIEVKHKLL